ncbi:MAG: tRNA (uridine(54)-C5)-methyltransferase TrmA [Pseudomonadales bacterium]
MTAPSMSVNHYAEQLATKSAALEARFTELGDWATAPELEIFPSAPEHFRMRAEFRVWHADNDLFYAMFPKGQKFNPIRIEQFPTGSLRINELMQPLLEAIKPNASLRQKLFQMDFLTSQTGEAAVSMLYHRQLDAEWEQAAASLSQQFNIKIIGRARKQKLIIGGDSIIETLQVQNRKFYYQHVENAFTQPNAGINEKMLTWACEQSAGAKTTSQPDLLELYCGNGNFTIPLAAHYGKVMATEIAKSSVNSAQFNLQANGVNNVIIARLSSEEMTAALNRERAFRRLQNIDLDDYQFGTVLVDPPRAGLDDNTLKLVQQFKRIIYISCNPVTLMANLQQLQETHQLQAKAMFDQFPYTDHVETGVVLTRI